MMGIAAKVGLLAAAFVFILSSSAEAQNRVVLLSNYA